MRPHPLDFPTDAVARTTLSDRDPTRQGLRLTLPLTVNAARGPIEFLIVVLPQGTRYKLTLQCRDLPFTRKILHLWLSASEFMLLHDRPGLIQHPHYANRLRPLIRDLLKVSPIQPRYT